ncbi:hypothetical protein F5888DRAFT_1717014 [Russula emetica]|nr:hypothetical protein F5888DRAFT_1717014 [Russula emetica]
MKLNLIGWHSFTHRTLIGCTLLVMLRLFVAPSLLHIDPVIGSANQWNHGITSRMTYFAECAEKINQVAHREGRTRSLKISGDT